MPNYTSPLAILDKQKRAFEEALARGKTGPQSWRQIPEGGFRDLKEATSGTISSKTLRQMGHPYARRAGGTPRGASKSYVKNRGKAKAPLLPVNQQSHRLNRSITLYRRSTLYTLEESVGFDAAKAGKSILAVLPQGTRYVVPRGVWVLVLQRGRARAKAFRIVFIQNQRSSFSKP